MIRPAAAAFALAVLAQPAASEPLPPLDEAAVHRLLARMSDAELRAFLAAELTGAAAAATGGPMPAMEAPRAEQVAMRGEAVLGKLVLWIESVATLSDRAAEVRARLASAPYGPVGMAGAAAIVAATGFGAAAALRRAAGPLRRALRASPPAAAVPRLGRVAALAAIDAVTIAAFVGATIATATPMRAVLGPMWDYVWIWHAGVSGAWTIRFAGERLIAAEDPALRLAALDDDNARALARLLRYGIAVGLGGWLVAGLFPTLGGGIGPAILIVLTSVTGVALWLIARTLMARKALALSAAGLIRTTFPGVPGALAQRLAQAAPVALAAYVAAAGGYWALHWLESGGLRLAGPLGAAAIALALPTLDGAAGRYGARRLAGLGNGPALLDALRAVWRTALGALAVLGGFALWGVDLAAFVRGEGAPPWVAAAADLVVVLALTWLAWRLVRAALPDMPPTDVASEGEEGGMASPDARRATLAPMLRSFLRALLATVAAFSILSGLGVDVGPLIASAGVVGIAIGFGAQTLVRDVFSGLFFIADDAFRLGEYVEFEGGLKGTVEAISPRSLRLRHHLGGVITVPFGELRSVTNLSRDWVIFRLDFRMEPETDPATVKRIVRRVGSELAADPEHGPKLIEPPKSQGVFMIDDDSALVIRVKFKSRPGAQWVLRRELYHRLTRAFAAEGVRLARRKVEVVGSAGPEVAAAGL